MSRRRFGILLAGLSLTGGVGAWWLFDQNKVEDGPPKLFQLTAEGKPICPNCGRSDQIKKYLFGLVRDGAPEGRVLGGCVIEAKSPAYKCMACETSFGRYSQVEP